jgi:hypothetical protein
MLREIIVPDSEHYDLRIPKKYINRSIEILVFPIENRDNEIYSNWSEKELDNIGKIGLNSKSLVQDNEEYDKW